MDGAGMSDMYVAPQWVTTTASWAAWWLSSRLRGPVLNARDLGLGNDADLLGPFGPQWSVRDLNVVTDAQIEQFTAALEAAVRAQTDHGRVAELTVQPGRSTLLAEVATQAGVDRALLPRLTGPWTITVTAEQARMRAYRRLEFGTPFTDVTAGQPLDASEASEVVMWPRPGVAGPSDRQ